MKLSIFTHDFSFYLITKQTFISFSDKKALQNAMPFLFLIIAVVWCSWEWYAISDVFNTC